MNELLYQVRAVENITCIQSLNPLTVTRRHL